MKRAAILTVMVVALLGPATPAPAAQRHISVSAFRTCHSVETRIEATKAASGTVTVRGRSRPWALRHAGSLTVSIPLHYHYPAADAVVAGHFRSRHHSFRVRSEYGYGEPCPVDR